MQWKTNEHTLHDPTAGELHGGHMTRVGPAHLFRGGVNVRDPLALLKNIKYVDRLSPFDLRRKRFYDPNVYYPLRFARLPTFAPPLLRLCVEKHQRDQLDQISIRLMLVIYTPLHPCILTTYHSIRGQPRYERSPLLIPLSFGAYSWQD